VSTLHPVLIVGLGSAGGEMARHVAHQLFTESVAPGPLIRTLVLESAGVFLVEPREETPADAATPESSTDVPPGAPEGGSGDPVERDTAEPSGVQADPLSANDPGGAQDPALVDLPPVATGGEAAASADRFDSPRLMELALSSEMEMGVWLENAEALWPRHAELARVLAAQVRALRGYATITARERSSGPVGEQVHVVVYASLADPVGSAALLPVLSALEDVFLRALADLSRTVQPVLFFPDLSAAGPPLAYSRAYACLRELEVALESGEAAGHPVHADRVWLLSSRNANDFFIQGHDDLVPVLTGHVSATSHGLVWEEPSPIPVLYRHVHGRRSRYGTFGFARLVFPREQLVSTAVDWAVGDALRHFPAVVAVPSRTDEIAARVTEFLNAYGFRDVTQRLRKATDGAQIFRPFVPPSRPPEPKLAPDSFVDALTNAYRIFEQGDAETTSLLTRRAEDLLRHARAAVDASVAARLRPPHPGAIWAAQAWAATLVGLTPRFVGIEGGRHSETLPGEVERLVFGYFEPRWEEAHELAHSSQPRRDRKQGLEQEIASKVRQLELTRRQREALEGSAEASAAPTGSIAPREETTYDAVAREASAQASLRVDEIHRQREMDGLRAREARLDEEVAAANAELATITLELADLEAAVRDPYGRGVLLERYQARVHWKLETDRGNHARAAEEVRTAYAAWDSAREWRRKCLLRMGLAAVPLAVAAVFAPPLGLAAVVAMAVWYPFVVGMPFRAAERVLSQARKDRDEIRAGMEASYAELAIVSFEHTLHSQLADFGARLGSYVQTDVKEQIERFGDALVQLGVNAAQRAERLTLPSRREIDYLLPPGGAADVVQPHEKELRGATDRVLRRIDLEALFAAYRQSSAALARVDEEIRTECLRALQALTHCTLNQFLEQLYPDSRRRVARLELFNRAAAPFGRKTIPLADDPSLSQAVLSVQGSPAAGSSVAEGLRACGCDLLALETENSTEASLLCSISGFAGFQFAGVGEAREEFLRLSVQERAGCCATHVEDEWLPDLFPPRLRAGEDDGRVRVLAGDALARGLASTRQGEAAVEYENLRFPSIEAWAAYLDGPSGISMLRELEKRMAGEASPAAPRAPRAEKARTGR